MTWIRRALLGTAVVAGALLAVAVLLVPYHLWDALSFGSWSVGIAGGEPLSLDPTTAVLRQRPLFYWLQGGVWAVLGVDERAGRLIAAAFFAVLAASVYVLAHRGDRTMVRGPLALALLLLSPEAVALAAAGLSDVPAAAMVGVTGAVALAPGPGSRRRRLLLAVMAAAGGVAKPSVFPALAGLGLATLIGPRAALGERVSDRLAPLAAGSALAVAYLVRQSRLIDMSLGDLLRGGNSGPHSTSRCDASGCEQVGELAARVRLGATLEFLWLGPFLRPFLVFALAFALLRLLRRDARTAFFASAASSFLIPWAGSVISTGSVASGPLGSPEALAYALPSSALLALGAWAPAATLPSRDDLARIAVWALPSVVVWLALTPFGPRLLAPAWPALLTLMALAAAPALAGAAARGRAPALALTAMVLLGFALNVRDLDGLDILEPRTAGSLAVIADLLRDPLMGHERARALADPELAGELGALRPVLGARGRVLTSDSRMNFFFRGRVTIAFPAGCDGLEGHHALLLLTNPVSRSLAPGETGDPRWWVRECPGTVLVDEEPGRYAVLAVTPDAR
jgi:hypothetical protein